MNVLYVFLLIVVILFFCNSIEGLFIEDYEEINNSNNLVNIYGEKLIPCRSNNSTDTQGSWNKNGYCDETGGGVHQICVNVDKTKNFSLNTGQGPWSERRKGKNHCMCLGAWALYKAKQKKGYIDKTDNELKCESIMNIAFHPRYINKWNTWNGNELPNQIKEGIDEIFNQCSQNTTESQYNYLKVEID